MFNDMPVWFTAAESSVWWERKIDQRPTAHMKLCAQEDDLVHTISPFGTSGALQNAFRCIVCIQTPCQQAQRTVLCLWCTNQMLSRILLELLPLTRAHQRLDLWDFPPVRQTWGFGGWNVATPEPSCPWWNPPWVTVSSVTGNLFKYLRKSVYFTVFMNC